MVDATLISKDTPIPRFDPQGQASDPYKGLEIQTARREASLSPRAAPGPGLGRCDVTSRILSAPVAALFGQLTAPLTMTNPYQQQQHGSSSFAGGDSLASGGLPPLNVRRPSYASVVSGSPSALARPARSGFSHLLNPSPDAEQQAYAGSPYSTVQNPRFEPGMAYTQNGGPGEEASAGDHLARGSSGAVWPPRLGSSFPYFSRAFDLYMSKDPLLPTDPIGSDEIRLPSSAPMPNVSASGFLSPSYLRGTMYLTKLEEKHRARILAERESSMSKGGPPSSSAISPRPPTNGSSSHLPLVGAKIAGSAHRGVSYDIVEKPMFQTDDDDTISPLPSRWNKEDKEAALEVLGDGYEVRHTGKASSDHEASAVRADHYMSPSCGVYYFEITILNGRHDKIK